MPDQRLHIPQGTEAFYLEEAYAHRELLRRFEDLCSLWGYLPVQTPVFDFHDLYRGLDDESAPTTYRLIDRDGDILVLRSDITLFLARQMGLTLDSPDLPVRVYYGDTILRHEDPNDLSKNEFFQVGIELIGGEGLDADAEVLLLLLDVTRALGAGASIVHIGSRGLLRSANTTERFARGVALRRWDDVRAMLEEDGVTDERAWELVQIYRFIGGPDELRDLLVSLRTLTPGERQILDHLLALSAELRALGYTERVRIDLSEVGDRAYYSGVVFHLYDEGADAPVAAGGRYDGLLGHFGLDAPSIGFSIMLRRLQSRLSADQLPALPEAASAEAASFRERVEKARKLHAQGKVAPL